MTDKAGCSQMIEIILTYTVVKVASGKGHARTMLLHSRDSAQELSACKA